MVLSQKEKEKIRKIPSIKNYVNMLRKNVQIVHCKYRHCVVITPLIYLFPTEASLMQQHVLVSQFHTLTAYLTINQVMAYSANYKPKTLRIEFIFFTQKFSSSKLYTRNTFTDWVEDHAYLAKDILETLWIVSSISIHKSK